ncbi:MAG: PadR family transcriptional regulator [Geminicoccaceae bacterium]
MPTARSADASALTVPDLVLLCLLSERPMHGYELVQELERREVRDWAEVSRPHVYYSLRKLASALLVAETPLEASGSRRGHGPDRRVYAVTTAGAEAFAAALTRPEWSTQRPPPSFRTWWMLAVQATQETRAAQIQRRRDFLRHELARERVTLRELEQFSEPAAVPGRQIVDLAIRQFETELRWLDDVAPAGEI